MMKNPLCNLLAICFLLGCGVSICEAKPLDKVRAALTLPAQTDASLNLHAKHMSGSMTDKELELKDSVHITYGQITFKADYAKFDRRQNIINAKGRVKILNGKEQVWAGDHCRYDVKTGAVTFSEGKLQAAGFTVKSDGLSRGDNGVFSSGKAVATTCNHPEGHWHWSVAGQINYKDGEWFEIKNVVPRFMGIPFLWMPYYYRDLNTHYGIRAMPGYSSDLGAFLRLGYLYPLLGDSAAGSYLSARTDVDLMSKRGVGLGQTFRWAADRWNQRGFLSGYFVNDREESSTEDQNWSSGYDEHRYSLKFAHRADFSPRDSFYLRGEYLSDSQFREDFDRKGHLDFSQPVSFTAYEHIENDLSLGIVVSGPLNEFIAGVTKLPEIWIDTMPTELFTGSKIYHDSINSISFIARQPAFYKGAVDTYRQQPGPWADYRLTRADMRHFLRRPFTLSQGVTLTPRAGVRLTTYSDSQDHDSGARIYGEVGARLQANYYAKLDDGIHHDMKPYLDWSYVPSVSGFNNGRSTYRFDRAEGVYEWNDDFARDGYAPAKTYNGIRFGVANFFTKETDDGTLEPIFDIDLYGVFVMDNADHDYQYIYREDTAKRNTHKGETGLRVLGVAANYTPSKDLSLSTTLEFDPEQSRMAFIDVNANYRLGKTTLFAGLLARDHELYDTNWINTLDTTLIYGGIRHTWSDIWSSSIYARYDIDKGDLEEIGGSLDYSLDCMTFRFSVGYLPAYTAEDRYSHDAEMNFSLGLWLKHFAKDRAEEWHTWDRSSMN